MKFEHAFLVRLRLVQMSYPAEIDEVWVMTLLRLSFTPLIHKDGLNDDLFTIVLDIISVMIDALSKPARQKCHDVFAYPQPG